MTVILPCILSQANALLIDFLMYDVWTCEDF